MADVIGLINDISPSVKLAWMGVLAWAVIQLVWYRRARVLPGAAESSSSGWSAGRQFPSVTRPPETDALEADGATRPRVPRAASASVDANADDVDSADADGNTDVAFAPDELAEFQDAATPRRRSGRRRRSSAGTTGSAVEFTLDLPKVT